MTTSEQAGRGAGIVLADPDLEATVLAGLAAVEAVLQDSVRSDLDFATEASLHLMEAGGKRIRPLFALLAAHFGDPSRQEVITSAVVVELIHLATLYHDDVMDEAPMRRGALSANARWNNSVAILTGDFLFAHASRLVADLGTDAARIIANTFAELVTGQMRETVGPAEGVDPVTHYLSVIDEKTGSLIATAGRFGGMFAGVPEPQVEALRRYGDVIGAAFQISDDIIDIASPAVESGKTPGTDLREGVRTLPMLYALADDHVSGARLRELLSRPLETDAEVEEALELLRASSGLEEARKTLSEYSERAHAALVDLPECPARSALSALANFVVARSQ
ncbi:polyprenyl synthetase family protein [Crossiella sp. CA-258035]|uniref:polyprenyl synthetase family protein n=1 Tax=Crossiella sp. CA-258035 TaxID=2981138 RepID=UPI0024BC8036|nr:polyprenyl synthetase family protein [Crossiella sp. CA-258035]WHT18984.1 polyprenyl synthetase family protein [Crossiella sp. CA-258035]